MSFFEYPLPGDGIFHFSSCAALLRAVWIGRGEVWIGCQTVKTALTFCTVHGAGRRASAPVSARSSSRRGSCSADSARCSPSAAGLDPGIGPPAATPAAQSSPSSCRQSNTMHEQWIFYRCGCRTFVRLGGGRQSFNYHREAKSLAFYRKHLQAQWYNSSRECKIVVGEGARGGTQVGRPIVVNCFQSGKWYENYDSTSTHDAERLVWKHLQAHSGFWRQTLNFYARLPKTANLTVLNLLLWITMCN